MICYCDIWFLTFNRSKTIFFSKLCYIFAAIIFAWTLNNVHILPVSLPFLFCLVFFSFFWNWWDWSKKKNQLGHQINSFNKKENYVRISVEFIYTGKRMNVLFSQCLHAQSIKLKMLRNKAGHLQTISTDKNGINSKERICIFFFNARVFMSCLNKLDALYTIIKDDCSIQRINALLSLNDCIVWNYHILMIFFSIFFQHSHIYTCASIDQIVIQLRQIDMLWVNGFWRINLSVNKLYEF